EHDGGDRERREQRDEAEEHEEPSDDREVSGVAGLRGLHEADDAGDDPAEQRNGRRDEGEHESDEADALPRTGGGRRPGNRGHAARLARRGLRRRAFVSLRTMAPTPHLSAAPGDFAPAVLMPGDPRRARRIAEELFDEPRLVTEVRGILGYTGTFAG